VPSAVSRSSTVAESSRIEETVAARLAVIGQRFTRGCRELTRAMAAADRPLTVPELVSATDGIPQSTAYRSIAVLREAGLVARVAGEQDHARFELTDTVLGPHHHYVVCLRCGRVEVVPAPIAVETTLGECAREVAREQSFQITGHRLLFEGLCPSCRPSSVTAFP
jgi:Fur family transcriptional regulator, ferric uptake regulator